MTGELPLVLLVRRMGDEVAPTISDLYYDGLELVVLERPRKPDPKDYAKDGKPHPCVPTGDYDVPWTENVHPEHPFCYQLITGPGTPAPDRSDVLLHAANWIRELLGCLAPGLKAEIVEGVYKGEKVRELGVSSSGPALALLIAKLQKKNFRLRIVEARDPNVASNV